MRVDNIDFFSASKLKRVIEDRFGQSIEIADLNNDSLAVFKESVQDSIKKFERSMGFNSNSTNAKYMENKVLLDYITKEQEKRMKVSKVQGDNVEIEDPDNPGMKTTIDTKKVDLDQDEQGNIKVDKKTNNPAKKVQVKPGQQISMEDLDDEARNFVDYIQDQGYKIVSQGAGPKGISIEYQDRDGNTHQVDFKDGKVTREAEEGNDLEDLVAPEFKKVVHDMQQGMNKEDIKKKYPKAAKTVDMVAGDLKKVMEVMKNHFLAVVNCLDLVY